MGHIGEIMEKTIELEKIHNAILGARAEIEQMEEFLKSNFSDWLGKTEEELYEAYEREYWINRLSHQIMIDLQTFGRIQAGNFNFLTQLKPEDRKKALALGLEKNNEYLKLIDETNQKHMGHQFVDDAMIKKLAHDFIDNTDVKKIANDFNEKLN